MYVDPGINASASNLKWVLPYCKPDLPRVVGALLLFIANNTMALTIRFCPVSSWTASSSADMPTNCHVCVD